MKLFKFSLEKYGQALVLQTYENCVHGKTSFGNYLCCVLAK